MTGTDEFRPGEAALSIDGRRVRLRLTLGALADLEDRLGGGDFEALTARLASPRVADLLILVAALARGGGDPIDEEALKASDLDLAAAASAVAAAFRALGDEPGKPSRQGQGPSPGAIGSGRGSS